MNKLLLDALSDRDVHGHNLRSMQYLCICNVTDVHEDSSQDSYLQVTAEICFHRHSMQIGRSKMTGALGTLKIDHSTTSTKQL